MARGAEDASEEGEQVRVPGSGGEGQLAFALATGDTPNQEEREALDALRAADLDRTTPLDALLELRRLKQLVAPESEGGA